MSVIGPREQEGASIKPGAVPWQRRSFHLLTGFAIPILVLFLPHAWAVGVISGLCGGALVAEGTRFTVPTVNRWILRWFGTFFKQKERQLRVTGATYLLLAALLSLLAFQQDVAALVLLFLSVGDPVAATVGERVSRGRFFGKSPVGSLAFFLVGVALAYAVAQRPELSFDWRLVAGAAVAALVELLPLPPDDNVTVPLISGAALSLLL